MGVLSCINMKFFLRRATTQVCSPPGSKGGTACYPGIDCALSTPARPKRYMVYSWPLSRVYLV